MEIVGTLLTPLQVMPVDIPDPPRTPAPPQGTTTSLVPKNDNDLGDTPVLAPIPLTKESPPLVPDRLKNYTQSVVNLEAFREQVPGNGSQLPS